jgi:hypothetical protein
MVTSTLSRIASGIAKAMPVSCGSTIERKAAAEDGVRPQVVEIPRRWLHFEREQAKSDQSDLEDQHPLVPALRKVVCGIPSEIPRLGASGNSSL